MHHTMLTSPPNQQQGATLIVVLMLLLLISLAGAMAVRQSNLDLQVATSDQIDTLLLQSADGANAKLEQMVNMDPSSQLHKDIISIGGMFGYYMVGDDFAQKANDEVVYCYNPRLQKYVLDNTTVRRGSGTVLDNGGYCDPDNKNDYLSARISALTQVSITPFAPPASETEDFSNYSLGKDVSDSTSKVYEFSSRSVSTIPAYADPGNCHENTHIQPNGSGTTVSTCLQTKNTPQKLLLQNVEVAMTAPSEPPCIEFGVGNGVRAECLASSSGGSGTTGNSGNTGGSGG